MEASGARVQASGVRASGARAEDDPHPLPNGAFWNPPTPHKFQRYKVTAKNFWEKRKTG